MRMVNLRRLCICFAGVGASFSALAQTWDGGGNSGSWGAGANWVPNGVPGNAVVTFDAFVANNQTNINLGGARTIQGIIFNSAVNSQYFTFSNGTFTIGGSGIVNND